MKNIRYVEMRHRGLVYITGEDAKDFLQSLISNDMNDIDHDTGIYAALLTPQGKYLHDLFICEGGPGIAVDEQGEGDSSHGHYLIDTDRPADLARRLGMYKLRAQVSIQVLDDWRVLGMFGSDLYEALGMRQVAGDARNCGEPSRGGRKLTDPRGARVGVRVYLPLDQVMPTMALLEAEAGSLADYDQVRICSGLPDGCRDIQPEKGTLLENRIDALGGVSWTKGCYVGQEVTARMKYRNLGKRQLFVVDLEGPAPAKGTEIVLAGQKVGELRTSVPGIGLAMLRTDAIEQFQLKGGDFNANGTHVTPRLPA